MTISKRLTSSETKAAAKKVNSRRSGPAMDMDSGKTAKTVYPSSVTKAQMANYRKNANRIDIVGVDAPAGTKATIKTPKKARTGTRSKGTSKQSKTKPKAVKRPKNSEKEDYDRFMELSEDYAVSKMPYNEDMREELKDDAHEEVARNSRWKWSNKDTKREFLHKKRNESEMMGYYDKKSKPKKRARK